MRKENGKTGVLAAGKESNKERKFFISFPNNEDHDNRPPVIAPEDYDSDVQEDWLPFVMQQWSKQLVSSMVLAHGLPGKSAKETQFKKVPPIARRALTCVDDSTWQALSVELADILFENSGLSKDDLDKDVQANNGDQSLSIWLNIQMSTAAMLGGMRKWLQREKGAAHS